MFAVQSNFFGNFKLGDNVAYNMEALTALYIAKTKLDDEFKSLLNKSIIINLASICEAILYDFNFRINAFTREGVAGLPSRVITAIQAKEYDEFEQLIACSKKHDFFKGTHADIYDDLTLLRMTRNRIHIQNTKSYVPLDEHLAYTEELVAKAERCVEAIITTLISKHPRPANASSHVRDMNIPWDKHFLMP